MTNTISKDTLAGFARQYSATAFKPYWVVKGQTKTFYDFIASFGVAGSALTEHKTKGGFINLHVAYPEKATAPAVSPAMTSTRLQQQVNAARAENKALKAATVKRTVKPTKRTPTVHRMSVADLNRLADLIAARR